MNDVWLSICTRAGDVNPRLSEVGFSISLRHRFESMPEQEAPPPRVHLISCLYVVTGLVVFYLICLRFYLPPSIAIHRPPNLTHSVRTYIHTAAFTTILTCIGCLAVSYWERFLLVKAIAGFIGITVTILSVSLFFNDASWGITGTHSTSRAEDMFLHVNADMSYYPLRYCMVCLVAIMLLRLFDYRPTTFRLTLLDVMLITLAVAVILGTRGVAMTIYGVT